MKYAILSDIHSNPDALERALEDAWDHDVYKVICLGDVVGYGPDPVRAVEVVTADSDKDRQLERFVANKVKVIANVAMLTEGFDQPDVTSVFARDGSRLPTVQMCGRGNLRRRIRRIRGPCRGSRA